MIMITNQILTIDNNGQGYGVQGNSGEIVVEGTTAGLGTPSVSVLSGGNSASCSPVTLGGSGVPGLSSWSCSATIVPGVINATVSAGLYSASADFYAAGSPLPPVVVPSTPVYYTGNDVPLTVTAQDNPANYTFTNPKSPARYCIGLAL